MFTKRAQSDSVPAGAGECKTPDNGSYKKEKKMNKYTTTQIISAWEAAYGEDMQAEYPGFFQRLQEEK